MTRGMGQDTWNRWLGVIAFAINANVNHTTGLTPFYLMFGREPMIPLHTIVGLPQLKALEPQDFVQTHALAMARQLTFTEENYKVYYKQTVATYKAKSLIVGGGLFSSISDPGIFGFGLVLHTRICYHF